MEASDDAVRGGCFGPGKGNQISLHGRSNSKGSILRGWWPGSTGNEDGETPEAQLERLADDLMLLGFEVDVDKSVSPTDSASDASWTAKPSSPKHAPKHERKLSWPFAGSRRVAPQRDSSPGRSSPDPTVTASSSVDYTDSPAATSPMAPADSATQQGGYRRLWQSITSVRKGDKVSSPSLPSGSQEFTVESLARGVLSLKPGQGILEAPRLAEGLQALDSRAVAALLKDLAKAGAPHRAGELFDYLRELPRDHNLAALADLYTYTTIISQCGGHQHLRRALELVAEMRSRGIQANIHTYSALMSVCIKCGECHLALDVYEQLRNEGLSPNMVTYNILIDAYARTGQWARAVDLLEPIAHQGLAPEARTYNAIIATCGKAGQPAAAVQVYERMLADGVEPTGTTYTSIISAFGRAGQVDEALRVYREMGERGCEPNVITYSSLISVCERAGRADAALQLYQEMRNAGVRPNVVTFNGLVAACAGAGMWRRAAELVESMAPSGCRPDGGTYAALIAAYERGGQWHAVLQALEKMQSSGVRPDAGVYNGALGALWSSGRLSAMRKAVHLLAAAQRQGALRLQTLSVGEATCTAYTPGAAILVVLKWLCNFRDGLMAGATFGATQPAVRSLLLVKGKHIAHDHSFEPIQRSLNTMFATFSVPATSAVTPQGIQMQADARMLPAWAASPSGLALLSVLDLAAGGAPQGAAALLKEDRVVELQCAKAFAAVRDFEARRAAKMTPEALEAICSPSVTPVRREIIACISALSNALGLRDEATHDAVQLCDLLFASTGVTNLPSAAECAAALLLLAQRQTGNAMALMRQGQMVLQAAGLPLSTILEVEQRLVTALGASPAAISPLRVLQLYLERVGCDAASLQRCQLLQVMALSATDAVAKSALTPAFARFDPSVVAAACLMKARESIGLTPMWPWALQDMTGFDIDEESDVAKCIKVLHLTGVWA